MHGPATPIARHLDRLAGTGRHERRAWVGDRRAHVEVRGLGEGRGEALPDAVEAALRRVRGVDWAEVNEATGRVVVAFEAGQPGTARLAEVLGALEAVERGFGLRDAPFPAERPEHPADCEPWQRNLIALGADAAALTVSALGRLLRLPAIPPEVVSAVAYLDSQPRLRRILERRAGHPAVELGLAAAGALGNAASQGPLSLVTDASHRVTLLGEIRARQAVWRRRETELCEEARGRAPAVLAGERPAPVPAGPIEAYGDLALLGALGAFGVELAATGSPRRAAELLVAGLPKAARQGREAFSSELGRLLASRDVVVMDAARLRLLDRVDTLVVDARDLVTGRQRLGSCVALDGREAAETYRRAAARWGRPRPGAGAVRGDELVEEPVAGELPRAARPALRRLRETHEVVLALRHRGTVVGLVGVAAELDPWSETVASEAAACGLELVVAGRAGKVARRLGGARVVAGGGRLGEAVRSLQADGRCVLAVSSRARKALAAADCGVGLIAGDGRAPWGAHLLCGPGLAPLPFLLRAAAEARQVSRRSSMLALAGSGVGAVSAIAGARSGGPGGRSGGARRASGPVQVATLLAQGVGVAAGLGLDRRPDPVAAPEGDWHERDVAEVLAGLGSGEGGLPAAEAERRHGGGTAARGRPSLLRSVASEVVNPLTPVLGAGAALSATVGSATDAALVGGVVAASAVLGGAQRFRTERSLEALFARTATTATVRRDGRLAELPARALVPGDVVELRAGDVVPADCRILETDGCEVDEATLTGESLPVAKSAEPTPGVPLARRASMVYDGTVLVTGEAAAVVVATGDATEARRALAAAGEPPASGVQARLAHLGNLAAPLSLAGGLAVTGLGLLRGEAARPAIASGVGVSVAAVPEGLPLLATVAEQAAARRLSERGALVRNPRTIEALGRVDMLCFDKTGTLTEGRIALRGVHDLHSFRQPDDLGDRARAVLAAGLRASPEPDDGPLDHATDRAVVEGAAAAGVGPDEGLGGWTAVSHLAFEPARGFHASAGDGPSGRLVSVKGAPEVLLERCESWRDGPRRRRLDGRGRRRLEGVAEELAGRGLRVLAVAERPIGDDAGGELGEDEVVGLELVGFVALADVARPTAESAVDAVRRAGVQVAMVTGDHPATAEAIARGLGILDGGRVLSGPDLDELDDRGLEEAVAATTVFARITPAQKVRIVRAYQRSGRAVAMTGDGANDAAAIRLADAGIALGEHSAPAAREAADLVVTDGRIETIVEAIIEGRALWSSVRDALAVLVGGNLGEIGYALAATGLTGSSPLAPRQLLLVNLLTDLLPALAITLRPPAGAEPEVLLGEGPEASLGAALGRAVGLRSAATSAGALLAFLSARATGRPTRARTVGLVALVGTQLGQTAVIGKTSPLVLSATAASVGVLAGVVQTPGLSQFFGCTPLGPVGWAIGAGSAAAATRASVALPWALAAGSAAGTVVGRLGGRLVDRLADLADEALGPPQAPPLPPRARPGEPAFTGRRCPGNPPA